MKKPFINKAPYKLLLISGVLLLLASCVVDYVDPEILIIEKYESPYSISLTWDPVPGARDYKTYYGYSTDKSYWSTYTSEDTYFQASGVNYGDTRYFQVQALSLGVLGMPAVVAESEIIVIFHEEPALEAGEIPMPANVSITHQTDGKVLLSWDDSEHAETWDVYIYQEYSISNYISSPDYFYRLNYEPISSTNYQFTPPPSGNNYNVYRIRAVGPDGTMSRLSGPVF